MIFKKLCINYAKVTHIQILMLKTIMHKFVKIMHIQILVFNKNIHKLFKNYACSNFFINNTKIINFLYKFFAFILQTFFTLYASLFH